MSNIHPLYILTGTICGFFIDRFVHWRKIKKSVIVNNIHIHHWFWTIPIILLLIILYELYDNSWLIISASVLVGYNISGFCYDDWFIFDAKKIKNYKKKKNGK